MRMTLVRAWRRLCKVCNTPVEHGNHCPSCRNNTFSFSYIFITKPKNVVIPSFSKHLSDQIKLDFD